MPDFAKIREWPLLAGGMFDETDVQQGAKVAVIGTTIVRQLFGPRDPIGETVTIGSNLPARIIGVLASKGEQLTGEDMDDIVLIPATTYGAFFRDATRLPRADASGARSRASRTAMSEAIRS